MFELLSLDWRCLSFSPSTVCSVVAPAPLCCMQCCSEPTPEGLGAILEVHRRPFWVYLFSDVISGLEFEFWLDTSHLTFWDSRPREVTQILYSSACSSIGIRMTSRLTSLWRIVAGILFLSPLIRFPVLGISLPFAFVVGTGQLGKVFTRTSLTTPLSSVLTFTTLASLYCPRRAFWSANQTTSPTATFRSLVCHLFLMNRLGPAQVFHLCLLFLGE